MKDERPTHLDLFSGIGGFTLAAEQCGFRTVGFSEVDEYANKWLAFKWPRIPNYGDIRHIHDVSTDLVTGGVPCQPSSTAGAMLGSRDERWLWPDAIRVMRESGCKVAVFENPPGIFTVEGGRAFNGIVSEISSFGYSVWWETIPACAIGSPQRRERVFLIAISDRVRWNSGTLGRSGIQWRIEARNETDSSTSPRITSNPQCFCRCEGKSEEPIQRQRYREVESERAFTDFNGGWDLHSPTICGVDDGLPCSLVEYRNRIRVLGNSIVPQVAYEILREIRKLI